MFTVQSLHFVSITLLAFIFVCTPCFAIHCYNCTSYNDIACNDPFQRRNQDLSHFVVECGENATFCRKTITQVYLDSVNQTMRVTRACGYLQDEKLAKSKDEKPSVLKCYRKRGSKGADVEYCACHSDRCNSANIQQKEFFIVFLTVSIIVASMFI